MTDINFLDVLKEKRGIVWPEIKTYLDNSLNFPDYCKVDPEYSSLINFHKKMISDYPGRKAKYVRPSLVLLTASSMGFSEEQAVKTAVAMEVSENWILIHDDIEDDSRQRRGKLVLHRIYGKDLSINAGDGLHVLMWRVLRDNFDEIGHGKALAIIDEFLVMLDRTVLGQTVEIKWTQENNIDLKDEDILFILKSKTGYYTIAGPMRLGAILAGANEEQLNKIYQFGELLGYCFQIQDDLLDLTSDFKGLKKQTGNDIYEGKRTIMLLHLLRVIKGSDRKKLLTILEKSREEKSKKEIQWVISKMGEYGSLDHGRWMIKKFANQAKFFFEKELGFLKQQPARNQLFSFIDFLQNRKY